MVAARKLFLSGLILATSCLQAQTGPQPEVRLEAHDGKTRFQIGEPILLDLVISNPTGTPMMLNSTDYGDNSDPVTISPKHGWIAWQGQSGHDYSVEMQLGPEPFRIPVRLSQVAIFREPGHYEVRVTENRVQRGSDLGHLSQASPVVSNEVGIDLEPMSEERESEIVRGVESDLVSAPDDRSGAKLRRAAVTRLAALQGNIALAEKVKLLVAEQEEFRYVSNEAWATTKDLKRQVELLEAAWRNPQIKPAYDMSGAMDETRRLLAGMALDGWHMTASGTTNPDAIAKQLGYAHQQDMIALLNSMPQRTGVNRRDAAYYLVEFGGLPDADQARAREYAVEEFPMMDDVAQHMLLETARPPFRDARLLPTLRTLLDRDPADKDALATYLDLAPDEAVPYVIRAICAPAPPLIDTFAKMKVDRLPQADACLLPLLQQQAAVGSATGATSHPVNPGRNIFNWKQHVMLAARFGTPKLLPAIESSAKQYNDASINDPGVTGALFAAEMRDAPDAALARLQHGLSSIQSWYETNKVFESAHRPFPSGVQAWLRDQVRNGSDTTLEQTAYELSIGGDTEDSAIIQQRLEKVRANAPIGPDGKPTNAETNLVSVLFGAKAWTLTPEERSAVTQGCITDACRSFAKR